MATSAFMRLLQCILCASFILGLAGSLVQAQEGPPAPADDKARIEQLEKDVQVLKGMLETQSSAPAPSDAAAAKKKADSQPAEKKADEEEKKKAEAEEKQQQGFVVGDDRGLRASWDAGGFRVRSADEAFSFHMGGRLMYDGVWWTQSPALRQSGVQPPGSPLFNITGVGPGIGDLQDAFFVRRARVVADGTIFQTIDFKVEFDFENFNSISFDESYVGARDLPWIDIVRIGQHHVPFGLEAYTSSRYLPQMERSPLFDAFYQEFAPGIFSDTTFFDQRVTTQHMFHRIDNFVQFNGASFGDGKYAYSGRVTALPIYEDDGRCLLHLGVAYQVRKNSSPLDFNNGTVLPSLPSEKLTSTTDLLRFRARPGLRDAVGLQGDNNRVVDTGNIIGDDAQSVNAEILWYWGPLWVQAEGCWAHVDNALFPDAKNAKPLGDQDFYGTYVQVGYFLTGDNRGYDRRMGKYDRVVPLENFFLVRDENGHVRCGLGAWELTYRYSFLNLNDPPIRGGTYEEQTVGLNWYWNSNIKLQLNYINGQRIVPAPAASGTVQGLGVRAALEF
jgi:phosphate-selective porin OprO/OprP